MFTLYDDNGKRNSRYETIVVLDGNANEPNYLNRVRGYKFRYTDIPFSPTDEEIDSLSREMDLFLDNARRNGENDTSWLEHIDYFEFEDGTRATGLYLKIIADTHTNHKKLILDWKWIHDYEVLNDCSLDSLKFVKPDGSEICCSPYDFEYRNVNSIKDTVAPYYGSFREDPDCYRIAITDEYGNTNAWVPGVEYISNADGNCKIVSFENGGKHNER